MAKTLTVPQMMAVAMGEGWAVVVIPHGNRRFCVRVWDRDRVRSVDGVHATFGPALRLALRYAFAAQDRQAEQEPDRPTGTGPSRPPDPALPSPELLAAAMATVCEVVA